MKFNRFIFWGIALVLALTLCAGTGTLAESGDFAYRHAVLAFQTPRDAELTYSESSSDAYFQTLFCAESGETIMSGAFSSTDDAQAKITALFGEAANAIQYSDALDAVGGWYAQWGAFTAGTGDSAAFVNVVTVHTPHPCLFVSVVPAQTYWGEGGWADMVYDQISSLEIFDARAALFVEFEDEALTTEREAAADLIVNAQAAPLLLNLFADVTDFSLSTVTLNEEGRPIPDEALFAAPALACGDIIRVRVDIPDVLPALAVSYTLPDGAVCLRYVTMSGLDGTLMLIEG